MKNNSSKHGFHLVDPSPWPFLSSFAAFILTFGTVLFFHGYSSGKTMRLGFYALIWSIFYWWEDITREATFEGNHTLIVQSQLRLGMLLFIVSELMFFFAFFWAFFHSSFNPSHAIGGVWPPAFLTVLDPWSIPLLNTVYLLTSGAFVTCAHNALVYGSSLGFKSSMYLTLFFAINFIFLQALEYYSISFSLSDTVYASVFFMLTGFHGFHVLMGTLFLMVSNFRIELQHYSREHHFGFEAAAWYWHFVDVIWLLLFVIVYWWGS